MIDFDTARQLVSEYLAKAEELMNAFGSELPDHKDNSRPHLVVTEVAEHDFGWLFAYNTKEYLETGEIGFALAGSGPIIVDRIDGQLYQTGSAHPVQYYLDQYRRGLRTPAS
jgi:Immunity protein 35